MGVLTRQLSDVVGVLQRRAAAPEQAGIFAGDNPATYNTQDPFRLWVIQVVVILAMTQLLAFVLARIRQPRVIAEVIGGVLLGPSVMGRIPGFTNAIFPAVSFPMINLTSTIGLVFFLFLVGLEIDVRVIKRNAKSSMLISATGLVIPLGLGAVLGIPIYHEFVDPSVNYGYFLLFTAVAIGITAFPVLCRILTELHLLDDTVGAVVLAAGVGNDVIGWVLLALTVALVNASSGLTALWVLLTGIGYTIFLLVPVRWAFKWLARRTGSLESGTPSAMMMIITLLLVLISAFFTDIIGIHAIFGGFLAGLVIPQENGFSIALVEKLEDLVSLLLLPLYFAFSGLKTNLGLLNNGVTWGYTILICTVAFFSKFLGCAVTAKLCGFSFRESGAIGSLMSCKGLVELIVLNVGLSAGILDTRTFSMFVLHALVLTFMTTPLTLLFYPAKYRTRAGAHKVGSTAHVGEAGAPPTFGDSVKSRFALIVDRIEQLPTLMTLTQLLQPSAAATATSARAHSDTASGHEKEPMTPAPAPALPYASAVPVSVDVLRLIELTERTSAVLKSQSADIVAQRDPILSIFRTFGYLNRMAVSTALAVVGFEDFAPSIAQFAREAAAQLVILPWSSGTPLADDGAADGAATASALTPFDALFGQGKGAQQASVVQTQFFRKMFAVANTDVALYVDRGLSQPIHAQGGMHVFLPFFGGPDDRLALSFVVQLCMNPSLSATVVRFTKVDAESLTRATTYNEDPKRHLIHHSSTFPDTVYALRDTQTRLASDTADNLIWERYTTGADAELASALGRIAFSSEAAAQPLHAVLDAATRAAARHAASGLLVVVGRSRRLAVESHAVELQQLVAEKGASVGSDTVKTLGDVGSAFVAANTSGSLLVLQAFLA